MPHLINIKLKRIHIFALLPTNEYHLLSKYQYPLSLKSLILPSIFDDLCISSQLIINFLSTFPNLNKLHLIGFGPYNGVHLHDFCSFLEDKGQLSCLAMMQKSWKEFCEENTKVDEQMRSASGSESSSPGPVISNVVRRRSDGVASTG